MLTAVIVAVVSGLVSLASVVTNAYITRKNSREESVRAKDAREAEDRRATAAREAEDRRLREARDAEANRRDEEAAAAAASAARAGQAARVQERWAAVRAVIDAEAKVRESDALLLVYQYRTQLQALALLTHPDETALRRALMNRARLAEQGWQIIKQKIEPDWWHPWVSEWARNVDVPLRTTAGDTGAVF